MAIFNVRLDSGVGPVSIEDWRKAARRRLPDPAWTFVEGGADDLVTLQENMSSFRRWRLKSKVLTGLSQPDMTTSVAGTDISMPLGLAPTGGPGTSHWTADIAIARAAEAAGTRLIYSTAGAYTPEEVAKATEANHWYQLYAIGDRDHVKQLIERARDSGYTALFVTVDVPVIGNREGEKRWPFQMPWTLTPGRMLHMAKHWRWTWEAIHHKRLAAINYVEAARAQASKGALSAVTDAADSTEAMRRQILGDLHWSDLAWIRDLWKGPLYVKGVLDPDDAAKAVDEIGAQGVVVSNHGGRQLDRCLSSIDALAPIVDRIGDRAEVLLDGGVRRGTDVVTALALGARAVFIGRPYLYGLAAAGETGVRSVLQIFEEEIKRALVIMGCPSVKELDRSWLIPTSSLDNPTGA